MLVYESIHIKTIAKRLFLYRVGQKIYWKLRQRCFERKLQFFKVFAQENEAFPSIYEINERMKIVFTRL